MSIMSSITSRTILRKTGLLTVLDIGSSKISCIIARLRPLDQTRYLPDQTHSMKVLGFGIQQSQGVKSGVIVDLALAEQAIRLAVDAAETMANLVVDSVIVNFTYRGMRSEHINTEISIDARAVTTQDIRRVISDGLHVAFQKDRPVIYFMPVSFSLDGEQEVSDPRDMIGRTLSVDMHVITVAAAPLRNLENCINRAHLSIEQIVVTPLASALSTLLDDEAQLGATCVDFGYDTTAISVFRKGKFVFADSFSIGSRHITHDIAQGFSISIEDAERFKVVYGSAFSSDLGDRDTSTFPAHSMENSSPSYQHSTLSYIIRARLEEMLEMVRDRLIRFGFGKVIGSRLILTGGGSQLAGLPDVARPILGNRLRIGRPLGISGLPYMAKGPAFSATVGLLIYPQSARFCDLKLRSFLMEKHSGMSQCFSHISQWFRKSF